MSPQTTAKDSQSKAMISALVRKRVKMVAKKTTVHGIRELYVSEKRWQSFLWLVIIVFCDGVCLYQTHNQFWEFINGRTATRISHLRVNASDMPGTLLRIPAWTWIDRRRLQTLNVSEEELLGLLAFFYDPSIRRTGRTSAITFDSSENFSSNVGLTFDPDGPAATVQQSQADRSEQSQSIAADLQNNWSTKQLLRRLNLSDPADLMLQLAFDFESFMFSEDFYPDSFVEKYKMGKGEVPLFVPVRLDAQFLDLAFETFHRIETYKSAAVYSYFIPYDRLLEEISNYGLNDFVGQSSTADDDDDSDPALIMTQGTQLQLGVGNDYVISYDVRILAPLKSCSFVDQRLGPKETVCHQICEIRTNNSLNATSCFKFDPAIPPLLRQDWPLCHPEVQSMVANASDTKQDLHRVALSQPVMYPLSAYAEQRRLELMDECRRMCQPPCYEYSVISSMTVSPLIEKDSIRIQLCYFTEVMVMQEVNAYSLFDLVSDVGGLVGFWAGASVISFFQFFHLLFVNEKTLIRSSLVQPNPH